MAARRNNRQDLHDWQDKEFVAARRRRKREKDLILDTDFHWFALIILILATEDLEIAERYIFISF